MRKVSIIAAILMLVSMISLAGCSSSSSGENASGSKSGDQGGKGNVTLRFATWDNGDALKIEQDIAKKFEEKNPGVKVQVEPYGDGFDQKLAASFGAKNPPDVMYMWNFPAYYESLEPLDKYLSGDADMDLNDFYQGLFNYSSMDGKTYGMPSGFTTRVVYYNKDLFDKAGIPYPKDGWTWDDFKQIAKKLSDPSKKQYGVGVVPEPDTYDLQGLVWSNGGSYISKDGKTIKGVMNSPETIQAISVLSDMLKDKSAVLVGGKNQQSGDDIFKAGKIAMWETGVWPLQGFKDAKINFGTVEVPSFGGKPTKGVIAASAISMAKDSKHKDLAYKFIKYFSSPEAIKMRTADLPVRISVVKEMNMEQDPMISPFYKMLERSTDTPAFLLNKNWNDINRNLSSAINAIMLGQDAKQTLNQAVKDSERYVK